MTSYQPSDQVKRTQKILESIEERKVEKARIESEVKRLEVQLEGIDRSLNELRTQFEREIAKFDPDLSHEGA